jgi:protein-disulfide isomerase
MESSNNKFIVPLAIIIAGLIIGGAIFYSKKTPTKPIAENPTGQNQVAAPALSPLDNLKSVVESDHILGNPDAPVTLILFSDLECFFCKNFHITMKQIMDEYGKIGKLKFVYRHLPLDIHPKSKNEAVASECAADLGGNEKFWQYIDRLFEITPSNNGLDPAELPKIAEYIGLNQKQFEQCLTSGKFDQRIQENVEDGMKSGALGTPYSILIGPNGKKTAIPGSLPYSDVKKAIDEMLGGK